MLILICAALYLVGFGSVFLFFAWFSDIYITAPGLLDIPAPKRLRFICLFFWWAMLVMLVVGTLWLLMKMTYKKIVV